MIMHLEVIVIGICFVEIEHMLLDVVANDIDPYESGLKLLAVSLDGYI